LGSDKSAIVIKIRNAGLPFLRRHRHCFSVQMARWWNKFVVMIYVAPQRISG
jgi:hypothetical protein